MIRTKMSISLVSSIAVLMLVTLSSLQAQAQGSARLDSLNALSKSLVCKEISKSDSISQLVISQAKEESHGTQIGFAYKNMATNQMCAANFRQSIQLFKMAIERFERENELSGLGATLNNLAISYFRLGDMDSAKVVRRQQLNIASGIGDTTVLGAGYNGMASIFLEKGQPDSLIIYAQKSLELAEEIDDLRVQGIALTNIGASHSLNENHQKAKEYLIRAKGLSLQAGDLKNYLTAIYNLAGCYVELQQMDSALVYFEEGIGLSTQYNDKYTLSYNYSGLAHAYYEMGDYQQSIKYNLLSKEINEEIGATPKLVADLSNLSSAYSELGDYAKGIKYARLAIELAGENEMIDAEADAYKHLSKALKFSDPAAAIEALEKYNSLRETYINKENTQIISELTTKYETEKKDQEIENLSQQAEIQSLRIQQNRITFIVAVAILVLIVLAVVLWNQRRVFSHRQAAAELEQKLLRLQMNPHFFFNALGSIQNFVLKNDTKLAGMYLAKFSKLMRQTLEFSREENITLVEEKELLTNYIEIHRLSSGQQFDYSIDIDESLDENEVLLPPMFAQPFVENAIEHGKIGGFEDGKLEINFKKSNDKLQLDIKDNGVGIDGNLIKEHNSLATTITRERLSILEKKYKTDLDLVIQNHRPQSNRKGTLVMLLLPLIK